ncbi:hypothetical protein [Novacetimonas pomaceti]|uniref:hypothetical protein n=1 Tax=Novacetimonas pomaceti TaxID=2021998 RepID=UPI000D7BC779|nr:hypothetical protein [Novacetimonas pomaceti]
MGAAFFQKGGILQSFSDKSFTKNFSMMPARGISPATRDGNVAHIHDVFAPARRHGCPPR